MITYERRPQHRCPPNRRHHARQLAATRHGPAALHGRADDILAGCVPQPQNHLIRLVQACDERVERQQGIVAQLQALGPTEALKTAQQLLDTMREVQAAAHRQIRRLHFAGK